MTYIFIEIFWLPLIFFVNSKIMISKISLINDFES